jgi:hypothetical protein
MFGISLQAEFAENPMGPPSWGDELIVAGDRSKMCLCKQIISILF